MILITFAVVIPGGVPEGGIKTATPFKYPDYTPLERTELKGDGERLSGFKV